MQNLSIGNNYLAINWNNQMSSMDTIYFNWIPSGQSVRRLLIPTRVQIINLSSMCHYVWLLIQDCFECLLIRFY